MFKKCLNKDAILKRKINRLGGGTSSRGLSKEMGKIERRTYEMRNRRIASGLLAAAMTLSLTAPSIPAAQAAGSGNLSTGYSAPWEKGNMPALTAAEGITPKNTVTWQEWKGGSYWWGGTQYWAEDQFGTNRQEDSSFATSSVLYDSVNHAIYGAQNFAKDQDDTDYVQFLTGHEAGQEWKLTVTRNDAGKEAIKTDSSGKLFAVL